MDCSGSLARLQQGEQTTVGVGDLFQRYKRTMVSWVRVTVKSVFFKNKFVMKFVKKNRHYQGHSTNQIMSRCWHFLNNVIMMVKCFVSHTYKKKRKRKK